MPKLTTITPTKFDISYGLLNAAQKRVVDAIEGPVMVIAGPGTGKTTILTLRIANILRQTDVPPDAILALTFTESGAYAMRRKLLEIIGPNAYKVNIHTFHGFAERIIGEYPDYFPRIIGSQIITDAEQIKIIQKIIESKKVDLLRPFGDPSYYVKPVLREIHILKRENVSPQALQKSVEADREKLTAEGELSATEIEKLAKRYQKNLELAFVYEKYEEELAKQKYYDFDDMLIELIRAMENNDQFKLILQENFQYILADEHQDANAAQNRILELLSDFHDSPNICIVGDDKQAIYRFQGASLENFLYFATKYPQALVIDLEHNYRSHQLILDAAHSLIGKNPTSPGRERTRLMSLQVGGRPILGMELPTRQDELEYVAAAIDLLLKGKEKAEEIAVLYRENSQAQALSQALKIRGIQHRIESDYNILGDIDSVKIITLCRAIHDLANDEYLGQALLLPELGCDPGDVAELFNIARREGAALHTLIKSNKKVVTLDHNGKERTPVNLLQVREAYARLVAWSRDAQSLPFPDFLQRLIQETNMLASITAAPNSLERLASLQAFFDKVVAVATSKKTFYLKDFIEYIELVSEHGMMSRRTFADHVGGVRLMTAHRAKGLEFNYVFIVHAEDGTWGNRSSRTLFTIPIIEHARDQGRIEDERRLFYVALTRAREGVTVTWARADADGECVPSQFIAEIDDNFIMLDQPLPSINLAQTTNFFTTPEISVNVSILDLSFVRSKFLSQPFSVTHLNSYLECPWRYFFVNLIHVPQAETKHQMYGTAIHAALRTFFNAYKEERDLSKKQLVDLFHQQLDRLPMSQTDKKEAVEKGKRALEGYYSTYNKVWNRRLVTEYGIKGVELELKGQRLKGKAEGQKFKGNTSETEDKLVELGLATRDNFEFLSLQLTGKLDKIEFIDEKNVVVVDYKTGKPKSRNEIEGKTKDADGNYKRQLTFYKLLLDGDGKLRMNSGQIDFIEPNDRGIYKKESFEITNAEVVELKALISTVADEILNLKFVNKTCDDKECPYCKLGKIVKR